MTTPTDTSLLGSSLATFAAVGSFIVILVSSGWGVVKWLTGSMHRMHAENRAEIAQVRTEYNDHLKELRAEILDKLDEDRRYYRLDRDEAAKWRENVGAMMFTRAEAERAFDRQTKEILDRLDARFRPLVERQPRRRGDD